MRTFFNLGLKAVLVLLGMALAGGGALAADAPSTPASDGVDFSLLLAPNLGSGANDGSWYDYGTVDRIDGRSPNGVLVRLPVDRDRFENSGLAIISVNQFFHGDVSADARIGLFRFDNSSKRSKFDRPSLQILATAAGNISTISTCMFAGCEGIAADEETENETPDPNGESGQAEADTFDLAVLMAPSLGAIAGPIDWNVGVNPIRPVEGGSVFANVRPFGPVLVQTRQILVGDVSSIAAIDTAITSPSPSVDQAEVALDLPEVEIVATSIGNAASFDTDVDAHVEADQIVVGAVVDPVEFDAAIDEAGNNDSLLSSTLQNLIAGDLIEKSYITADASADTLVNTLADVSAVALANNYSIGENAMSIEGLVNIDLNQLAYADTRAIAHVDVVGFTQPTNLTVIASALGNVLSATSPSKSNLD